MLVGKSLSFPTEGKKTPNKILTMIITVYTSCTLIAHPAPVMIFDSTHTSTRIREESVIEKKIDK